MEYNTVIKNDQDLDIQRKSSKIILAKKDSLVPRSPKKKRIGNRKLVEMLLKEKGPVVDIRASGPFDFLPNYKNPCWREVNGSSVITRCLPYFFSIGCSKCGTTYLWNLLSKHPEIADTLKETGHYINGRRLMGEPLGFYLDWFMSGVEDIVATKDANGYHSTIMGDGNPAMMYNNLRWKLDPANDPASLEPRYTNADTIFDLNPKAKIIAILRDPVTRLISEYTYFEKDQNKSAALFHDRVVRKTQEFRECTKDHTARYCAYKPEEGQEEMCGRIHIGLYAVHLKEFYRVFPQEQVLVLSMESCSRDYAPCLQRAFNFLDLGPVNNNTIRQYIETTTKVNKGKTSVSVWNSTKQLLKDFYKPYNEELRMILGSEFHYN
ncbi:carbohydrate sulfotransferase 15-like [Mya arenaria]|uniref:carbohydrate sulfotransferase 15-like n=1 Tax=Mya arenaria TaxID=6604 RepID=UPI0022E48A8D|nr:carbohydrate sulfotransferase 15-like [Mya arenaria]